MFVIEKPISHAHAANSTAQVLAQWNVVYDVYTEAVCLMLKSMTPELHTQFENSSPYEMLQELKSIFKKQAGAERFVRKYNMHNMEKTIGELHALLLIEYEKSLPKKAVTPQVMTIQGGRIQKANKKLLNFKGKEHSAKDDACHHYKEVGHCKSNCSAYLAELIKKKKQVGIASSSGYPKETTGYYFYFLPENKIVVARFVRKYNMHNMEKTIGELHALLIEYEKSLPKKAVTPQVMTIQGGRIQKANKKLLNFKGKGIASVEIIDRQLPFEYIIASRSTDVIVWNVVYDVYTEAVCLMLRSMTPELHTQFENSLPYEMLQELKSIFEKQAGVERFELIQTFHAYKQEEGTPVGPYVIKMKGYVEQLKQHSAKGDACHHYKEVGHCKSNCSAYLAELIKKKKQVGIASSSGYPKETTGYYFYFLPENKIVVASEIPMEVEGFEPPQEEVVPVHRSARTHRDPNCLCLNVKVEEYSLGDLNEPTNYKAALLDPESDKEATFILGIKIYQDKSKRLIGLSQSAYMDKILKRLRMDTSKCGYIPMKERLDLNKTQASIAASEAAMYSASVADIAVVLCLELFQSTAPPFKMKTYPV
nr:hypothetical protein [Tanacetum cinerariifolium]